MCICVHCTIYWLMYVYLCTLYYILVDACVSVYIYWLMYLYLYYILVDVCVYVYIVLYIG